MTRRGTTAVLVLVLTAVLGGCATEAGGATSPPPTPTCAVPIAEGSDASPPQTCAAYDPQPGMDQNEAHKERMEPAEGDGESGADLAAAVRAELESLTPGATGDDVRAALESAGVHPSGIQLVDEGGRIRFGAVSSGGGDQVADCVFGEVAASSVSVEVGGLVRDGGCLAMDGH